MAYSLRAHRTSTELSSSQCQLRVEHLERRDLLANAALSDLIDWELWQELFAQSNTDQSADESSSADDSPLPVIPLDDSVGPLVDCPGLDDEFCLPTDGELQFGFEDFLRVQQNFGLHDATLADGDFDGDGIVGFSDFLIVAEYYG